MPQQATPPPVQPRESNGQPESIEAEVLANILRERVGSRTFAEEALPAEYLRREADRIIRESFNQRHRIVVRDADAKTANGNQPGPRDEASSGKPRAHAKDDAPRPRIIDRDADQGGADPIHAALLAWPEAYPSSRGFMPALTPIETDAIPFAPESAEENGAAAAELTQLIDRRLARDGLLFTLAQALQALNRNRPERAPEPGGAVDEAETLVALSNAGFPIDLLAHFSLDGRADPNSIVRYVLERLGEVGDAAQLADELRGVPFAFHATHPSFALATESGEHAAGLLRLQISRGDHFFGAGDGGGFDMAIALIRALPEAAVLASLERRWLDPLLNHADVMPTAARTTIIVEPRPVAQWAQDNGKPGTLANAPDRFALLVPRFANRGELGAKYIPQENALLTGLPAAGITLVHSPLQFQGGNLLAARDPRDGARILLIGEAEIHRNVALGLSPAQAIEAFRLECGVDRCLVLPSVSFHIDYDVTVRASGGMGPSGRLLAFVNDHDAAVRIILRSGTEALVRAGLLDPGTAARALADLHDGRPRGWLQLVANPVLSMGGSLGRFPLSLAEHFSTGPADSGVGNFQVFLAAIDELTALTLIGDDLPAEGHAGAHLRSLRRLASDRAALHERLRGAGFEIVPVPSLALAERSVNTVNGIHLPDQYLMPACGGLYARLDEAAAAAFRAALGPEVRILPILTAESQRRVGALHCSASIHPAPAPHPQ